MPLGWWIDFAGSCAILVIIGVIWWTQFRRDRNRRIWRCVRWQGGGSLVSPRPMTQEEVTLWLARHANAEVGHVDTDHGFIFYRPRG